MAIKSVPTFSPAVRPHADWVDKNVGNKDGQIDAKELEAYKAKFPDATMYEPLKNELGAVTGQQQAKTTTVNPQMPVAVGKGAGVLGFRLGQAAGPSVTPAPSAPLALPPTDVPHSLPMDALSKVGASAAGDVFHLDSSSVAVMSVRARQVVHPTHGPGTELMMRLTPQESMKLSLGFQGNEIAGAAQSNFVLEKSEFKDGATHLAPDGQYEPKVTKPGTYQSQPLQAFKVEEPGKFSVEYVPPRDNPQAYRDRLRIRVFGATDAERKANMQAALARIERPELVADADPLQAHRMLRLSAMRMVAPARAEELGRNLDAVPLEQLDKELAALGVDADRLNNMKMEEVFAGTMAPVDPALGEHYAKLGVKGVMVGIKEVGSAALILSSDGLMASLERYGRGLHKAGASLTSDEASGGAEFAFTRLVTPKAIEGGTNISSSFGAGKVQLISVGEPMKKLLSRTDWHAYPNDSYGTTVSRAQAEGPGSDALAQAEFKKRTSKFSDRPVLEDLVKQVNGDVKPPNSWGGNNFAHNNEACFKNGVQASAFTHAIVQSEAVKTELIKALKDSGVTTMNGKPVEECVVVASNWKQVGEQLGLGA